MRLERKVWVWAPGPECHAKVVGLQLYSTVTEEPRVEAAAVGRWQEHFLGIRGPGYKLCLGYCVTSRKSFWGLMSLVKFPRSRASDRLCPWLLGECGKLGKEEVAKPACVSGKDLGLIHRCSGCNSVAQSSLGKGSGFALRVSYHRPAGHPGGHPGQPARPPKGTGDGYCSGAGALGAQAAVWCLPQPGFLHTGLIYWRCWSLRGSHETDILG